MFFKNRFPFLFSWKYQKTKRALLYHPGNKTKSPKQSPPFTNIYKCAYLGQEKALELFLKIKKTLLNAQDKNGMTLLHHAVLGGKISIVRYLIKKGANLNISDFDGCLPIFYSKKCSHIFRLLRKSGALLPDESTSEIHHVAREGNLKRLRAILSKKPDEINVLDSEGWSPLFYAVVANAMPAIELLIEKGAKTDLTDDIQCNLIDYAKENRKHTHLSKFLKSKMGLEPAKLQVFKDECQRYLQQEMVRANQLNKKMLIILGESHGDYKIYQLEKTIIMLAKTLGINWIYTENNPEKPCEFAIDFFAKDKLKMSVVGIDEKRTSMRNRNQAMSQSIFDINKSGVLLVGSLHLHGLLKNKSSRIDTRKFHVVVFNLASIIKGSQNTKNRDSFFAYHDKKVIQVKETTHKIKLTNLRSH